MQTIDFENGDFFMQRSGDELTRHAEPGDLLTKMAGVLAGFALSEEYGR